MTSCLDAGADKLVLEQYVPQAVRLLRWDGILAGPLRIAGRRVSVVVSVIDPVHEHRQARGLGPVVDKTSIEACTQMPALGQLPPVAVQLVGVIAPIRHLGTARHSVFPFSMMCPAGIVMHRSARNKPCVPERRTGLLGRLGVVAVDEHGSVDVMRDPLRPLRYPPDYEVWRRWVLEVMYERALHELAKTGGQ